MRIRFVDLAGTKIIENRKPIDSLTETVQAGKHVKRKDAFSVTGNALYEIYYTDFTSGTKAKLV
ncbi:MULTISPECIES: hypothetical protein [Bacillus]|uniref:hypothetical protein n=1 Tax=Bacillus TaxID=1386 RepID=UPI000312CB6E|nr:MULTISPECIES: hypothetical protein [Bacillus]MBO1580662.1 hypothetical protein [Bacillus sp. XF8]MBY0599434.1 hypothetical protein [Bacillus bingmayongensis]